MVDLAYKTGNLVNPIDIINKKDDDKKQQNLQVSEQLLRNIMSSGAREFNQKIGRPMTYGEMREMWG
jgi:hypothetical protein